MNQARCGFDSHRRLPLLLPSLPVFSRFSYSPLQSLTLGDCTPARHTYKPSTHSSPPSRPWTLRVQRLTRLLFSSRLLYLPRRFHTLPNLASSSIATSELFLLNMLSHWWVGGLTGDIPPTKPPPSKGCLQLAVGFRSLLLPTATPTKPPSH